MVSSLRCWSDCTVFPASPERRGLVYQAGYALSYSLAHLAVPYGGWQDARLEPKYILNTTRPHPASALFITKHSETITSLRSMKAWVNTACLRPIHSWPEPP
jgi:hypothetical protein